MWRDVTSRPSLHWIYFYCPTSACLARRFLWHALSKQRSCPLIPGFSLIWVWVTQSCLLAPLLYRRRVPNGHGEGSWYSTSLYRDQGSTFFFQSQSNPPLASSSNTQSSRFRRFGPSMISGSDLQGRWMPSSITEEDVRKLRDARYLTYEISHRLPAQGLAIPTP